MNDTLLTVQLYSFSYKQRIPGTESAHGGGFYFDCRCLPNPGREAEFKTATGLDEAVVMYLEAAPAVEIFYQHTKALVLQAITCYRERAFDSLIVAYGCTGGQHRSVYCAERLQTDLKKIPGVAVSITHCEADRWPLAIGGEPG